MQSHRQQARAEARTLRDILLLADCRVPVRVIEMWRFRQAQEAELWATKAILSASDNPVRVPPRPAFLNKYAGK